MIKAKYLSLSVMETGNFPLLSIKDSQSLPSMRYVRLSYETISVIYADSKSGSRIDLSITKSQTLWMLEALILSLRKVMRKWSDQE